MVDLRIGERPHQGGNAIMIWAGDESTRFSRACENMEESVVGRSYSVGPTHERKFGPRGPAPTDTIFPMQSPKRQPVFYFYKGHNARAEYIWSLGSCSTAFHSTGKHLLEVHELFQREQSFD